MRTLMDEGHQGSTGLREQDECGLAVRETDLGGALRTQELRVGKWQGGWKVPLWGMG